MVSVFDVAQYIIHQCGTLTAMKLQKLCYYAQAWSLVWDERPLFKEEIQAWANGPVIPDLYARHRGNYTISPDLIAGNKDILDAEQRETVDKVISFYGKYNPQQLSDLTHLEDPWRMARHGVADGQRGSQVISYESMAEYYSQL